VPDPVKRYVFIAIKLVECFFFIKKLRASAFTRFLDISQIYFEPDEVRACIVTCGGLCPGLNTVIREIVYSLYHMYGVTRVLGIDVSNC
jgi:hypothetical protein